MLVSELITRINYALRGTDDDAPIEGSADADQWLSYANVKKDEWARDANESWSSLFAVTNLSSVVVSGTQTYNLATTFMRPADRVYVTTTDDDVIDFNLVEPQLRDTVAYPVYIAGDNPKKLTFVDLIDAGHQANLIGGTITVPGYFLPTDMTAFSGTVPVDDPNWLVYAVASEVAFNDVTYEDKVSDLNAKSNSLYMAMKQANRRGTPSHPRRIPTVVSRIKGMEAY